VSCLECGFYLRECRDVFTPSAKQEAQKEVAVEVKSTAATETSESGSPMTTKPEQSLSRRGSGKLGSRSNSYQTLRRNSSSSSRISKHAKTESGVFHVSSKKRIYTTDFLMVKLINSEIELVSLSRV